MSDNFAPPLSKLSQSGIGVAAAPSGGKGLALDLNGKVDGALLKDTSIPAAAIPEGGIPLSKLVPTPFTNPYIPTWTATTTNPAIGNGTLTSRYLQLGKLVIFHVDLTAGTTTTFGTGNWRFSLPVTPVSVQFNAVGLCNDTSTGLTYGAISTLISGTSTVQLFTMASPIAVVGSTVPFTWASTDTCFFELIYEAA